MDKVYNQKDIENKWYKVWEEKGYFKPEINPNRKPFTIILPPPNANGNLHFGHAMFTVEDILIRFHRMKGEAALWLPGEDHAGTETQFVFEKHLSKMGKTRFDFDRPTLYQMIWDFVEENRGNIRLQMKRMGFSLDWDRLKYTLDPDIVKIVYKTFKKLFDEGLAYRAERLVNYCTKDGTSFSDLEVVYEERKDPLYYIKYGPLTLATVRPETKFGDTAVAVHPSDKRYQQYVGKEIEIETVLGKAKIKVVADEAVDPQFGTGVVKVTPAHDPNDFEISKRHNLPLVQVIGYDGRMNEKAQKFAGMKVKEARQAVVEALEEKGLMEKVDYEYTHRVGTCYKCKSIIEPLPLEQWFISTKPLAKKAIEAVKDKKIKIFPKNFEKVYLDWLENIRDWNISRQIVWGIQIPAYFCDSCKKWVVTEGEKPDTCPSCNDSSLEQDKDTFDTWFSSGQWPFVTLQSLKVNPSGKNDFEKFYPTSVMETGRDILFFWVARMVMLGIYTTGEIPFKDIVLHGTVLDPLGQKMSKSKGNVVNPIEIADQYGADAVRMALMYGTAFGHDQALSHPKLSAMRNFTNKLWNIGRFIIDFAPEDAKHLDNSKFKIQIRLNRIQNSKLKNQEDQKIIEELSNTIETVTKALDGYRFHDAAESLYEFIWHQFADKYIEDTKNRRANAQPILEYVFRPSLELLHPLMPFITEELWQKLPHNGDSIMVTRWPGSKINAK